MIGQIRKILKKRGARPWVRSGASRRKVAAGFRPCEAPDAHPNLALTVEAVYARGARTGAHAALRQSPFGLCDRRVRRIRRRKVLRQAHIAVSHWGIAGSSA